MTTESDLLQAIWDAPDDDLPRLVYADWLDEQGDPRGEFIRVQCELANGHPNSARRQQLKNRERELLNENRAEWLAGSEKCGSIVTGWEFDRGFVEGLTILAERLEILRSPLKQVFPTFRRLKVQSANSRALQTLAESRHVAGVTKIHFERWATGLYDGGQVRTNDIRRLVESPFLTKLDQITLSGTSQAESFLGLFEQPVARWKALSFNGVSLEADWIQTLILSHSIRNLRKLTLNDCCLSLDRLYLFCLSSHLTQLETLSIAGNRLNANWNFSKLRGLRHFAKLKELDLTNCEIGGQGVEAILESAWQQLTKLKLAGNAIGDHGLIAIANSDPPRYLSEIDLDNNNISDDGLIALSKSPVLGGFRKLALSDNQITDKGLIQFAKSAYGASLEELYLPGNPHITDHGGWALANGPFQSLKFVDLSRTRVSDDVTTKLIDRGGIA